MTTATRSLVVLNSQNEWVDEITSIKTVARGQEIWKFIDPDTADDKLLSLFEPVKPAVEQVKELATTFLELDPGAG
jgi:hypothetical protein